MPRAEVVKLLVRSLGYEDDGTVTSTVYPDVTEDFYYIAKATELGIITGKPDGTFAPGEGVDRGSAAAMLLRAMDVQKHNRHKKAVRQRCVDVPLFCGGITSGPGRR